MAEDTSMLTRWAMTDATVVAIADRGAVYVETGLRLTITEGRGEVHFPLDEDEREEDDGSLRTQLQYQLNFYLADAEEPDGSEQKECRAALLGKMPDGRRCKVVGSAYVGRDNLGQLEGTFFKPPVMEFASPESDIVQLDDGPVSDPIFS